ncbi:hypothetical protein [Chlamydia suis]|uniref:Inclusion membrane protein-42 n=1 Tax=Chlamydia suis TaxID=83559 RepID=A0ABX6IUA1_9CHLA|nr:hypothetical protein [Chlamydia suis]QHP83492.1 putative inclusion membrane protein-42 [Chlamydia suis]
MISNDPEFAAAAQRLRETFAARNGRTPVNPCTSQNNPFTCSNGSSGLSNSSVSDRQHIGSESRRGSTSSVGSASSVGSDGGDASNFDKALAVAKLFFEKSWSLLPIVGVVVAAKLIFDKARGRCSDPSWEKRFCLSMLGGLGVIALVAAAALCILIVSSLFYLLGRGVANMIQCCATKQHKTID